MDANALNYWLSKFVQQVANSEGRCIQRGPFMELSVASEGIYKKLGEAKHLIL